MSDDLISRQAAIDLLRKRLIETANNNVGYTCDAGQVFEDSSERIKYWIDELPSAEPEIIYCKDCLYGTEIRNYQDVYFCNNPYHKQAYLVHSIDFCSYAERRINETD